MIHWGACRDECCQDVGGSKEGRLCMLQTVLPPGLLTIQGDGWEEFEMAVGSGASETVIGENMVMSAELKESDGSKKGIEYTVANGHTIPNLGEKRFAAVTEEGVRRNFKPQVCDVTQGLLSVKKMLSEGHRVVFDPHGSYIEDIATYERMALKERNGMYFLSLWTKGSGLVFKGRAWKQWARKAGSGPHRWGP